MIQILDDNLMKSNNDKIYFWTSCLENALNAILGKDYFVNLTPIRKQMIKLYSTKALL